MLALGACQDDATDAPVTAPSSDACPDIGFEPGTDRVAFNVRSQTSLGPDPATPDCARAEAVVRRVADSHNFVTGPRQFDAGEGWHCTVATDDEAMPVGHYQCYEGSRRVTWDRT
ncbi:MAG TPA: hypothetical protein VM938_12975 [Acidimicrobiales bacterium]|nr:hypothetical protein [Acidimicrobiales bacterium]